MLCVYVFGLVFDCSRWRSAKPVVVNNYDNYTIGTSILTKIIALIMKGPRRRQARRGEGEDRGVIVIVCNNDTSNHDSDNDTNAP